MSDEEPVRLKDQHAASPELVRALRALGRSGADRARLERVAEKLGDALQHGQPPTAAETSGGLFAVKTLVVAVVASGLAALGWFGLSLRAHPLEQRPPASSQQPASASPPPTAAGELAPEPAAPEATEATTPAAKAAAAPARRSPAGAPKFHALAPASAARNAEVGTSAHAASTNETATNRDPARATNDAAPHGAPQPRSRAVTTPQPPAAKAVAPQPSEATLLFRARKAMASQPMAAVRLLEEHAARFPEGQLAPEREVLRIEALRRLGRSAEADQLLRAFQARYPDSLHLRRLEHPETGAR